MLPGRKWVNHLVAGVAVPAAFAALYTVIIAVHFFGSAGGFSSLADVALLFSNPWLLLAGWIHYLAFDLLVGSWEARDARERGIQSSVRGAVPGPDVPVWSGGLAAVSRRPFAGASPRLMSLRLHQTRVGLQLQFPIHRTRLNGSLPLRGFGGGLAVTRRDDRRVPLP